MKINELENLGIYTASVRRMRLRDFVCPTKPKKMKITIRHDQSSIDPSATYTEEQFAQVKESLEREYTKAILAEYPDAEIEFEDSTDTHCLVVKDSGLDDPSEIHFNIQRITETVFETGLFWL